MSFRDLGYIPPTDHKPVDKKNFKKALREHNKRKPARGAKAIYVFEIGDHVAITHPCGRPRRTRRFMGNVIERKRRFRRLPLYRIEFIDDKEKTRRVWRNQNEIEEKR